MEYSDQSLFVSDLATVDGANYVIDGSTFKDCTLRGPAVVWLLSSGATSGGIEIPDQNPSTVVIVAEEDREALPVGVVAIRNCKFDNCNFEGITFMAPADEAEKLRTTFMSNV